MKFFVVFILLLSFVSLLVDAYALREETNNENPLLGRQKRDQCSGLRCDRAARKYSRYFFPINCSFLKPSQVHISRVQQDAVVLPLMLEVPDTVINHNDYRP